MLWYDDGIKHRLRLRPQWTTADAEDLFDDAPENEAYTESIRQLQGGFREYGPLMNRVSSELNKSIFHASDVLSAVPGTRDSENKLRETVKKYVNKARRLVGLLGCATNTEDVFPPAPMRSLASSSHAASSSRAVQDDEEESDDDDDAEEDEEEGAEEEHGEEEEEDDEEEYDDDDGPPATQPTQREKRNVPKKDWKSPSPFQKARPTARKKTATEKRSKDNEDRKSKRGRKD
nr:nucleolin-like [Aegilops tauschii subsp. strangulata]